MTRGPVPLAQIPAREAAMRRRGPYVAVTWTGGLPGPPVVITLTPEALRAAWRRWVLRQRGRRIRRALGVRP